MEQPPSNENVNQIVLGIANSTPYLSDDEIRQMLTALNNVTDPEQIERIRRRITIITIMYGIDLNPYLDSEDFGSFDIKSVVVPESTKIELRK